MEKYYSFSWKDGKEPLASAFAPKGSKADHELIQMLNGINKLPFELSLVKLDVGKNGLIESNDLSDLKEIWLDYQPNSLAWPLMSERLLLSLRRFFMFSHRSFLRCWCFFHPSWNDNKLA